MRRALVLAVALLAACEGGDREVAKGQTSARSPRAEASVDPVIARAGGANASKARPSGVRYQSWDEFLMRVPADERKFLRDADTRYWGMLSFRSSMDLERLRAAGFPTPEQWLEARIQSDTELEVRAAGGDVISQLLYADRLASRASDFGPEVPPAERTRVFAEAVKYSSIALSDPAGGAFAAYVYGYVNSQMTRNPEYALAGALLAGRLGDQRAPEVSLHIQQSLDAPINAAATHVAYMTMERIVNRRKGPR